MGAWEITPFDNDDAADFLGDLRDAASKADTLDAAFAAVRDEEYVEAPEGSVGVAAAAVVAIALGREVVGVNAETASDIAALGLDAEAERLRPAARAALDRIAGADSELAELWEEAEQLDEWRATLTPIRAALDAGAA